MIHAQEATRPTDWPELMGLHHKSNGENEDREILMELAETGWARSLMFIGPAGTGKTSAARIFASKQLKIPYEEVLDSPYYKELNASSDRGIDVIRGEMQIFAKIPSPEGITRILMIDEAGGLTRDAKEALKKISEKYAYNCIFIYCLNYPEKITGPLYSRSKQIFFDPIEPKIAIEWLERTAELYNIVMSSNAPKQVITYYKGDLRQIVSDFIIPYQNKKVSTWNPRPTHAEQIFSAKDPAEEYMKLATKHYIPVRKLLEDLFLLNNKKSPIVFLKADLMLSGGGSPFIAVCAALTGLVKA